MDDAESKGYKRAKRDAALLRRIARGTTSATQQFKLIVLPEEAEALFKAALILRTLSGTVEEVAAIAKVAIEDRERRELDARHKKADLAAATRWDSDDAMQIEALDLAAFVDEGFANNALFHVLSSRPEVKSAHLPERIPRGMRLIDMLNAPHLRANLLALKRRAAEYLLGLEAAQIDQARGREGSWPIGLNDYETWRESSGLARSALSGQ